MTNDQHKQFVQSKVVAMKEVITQLHTTYSERGGGAIPKTVVFEDLAKLHRQACYLLFLLGVPKVDAYISFIGPQGDPDQFKTEGGV